MLREVEVGDEVLISELLLDVALVVTHFAHYDYVLRLAPHVKLSLKGL